MIPVFWLIAGLAGGAFFGLIERTVHTAPSTGSAIGIRGLR